MIFNFDNKERNRLFAALIRAQGDILEQLTKTSMSNNKVLKSPSEIRSDNAYLISEKKKLYKEYNDIERIAQTIQRSFE